MVDTIEDIASLVDSNSIVRSAFKGKIELLQYSNPEFRPDQSYEFVKIKVAKDEDTLDHYPIITEICKQARAIGRQEKFHSGVIEAFRNAYQHGNKKDPQKLVTIYHRLQPDFFEVAVADEGGEINADFIPFILLHRYKASSSPLVFYDFSRHTPKSEENSGIGTSIIHKVSDKVNYFRNPAGGLTVQMILGKK